MDKNNRHGVASMNTERKIQIIEQYIGATLLAYTLNINTKKPISHTTNEIKLSSEQVTVINNLSTLIETTRINYILAGGTGDDISRDLSQYNSTNNGLFNIYRQQCGGDIPTFATDDAVLSFLYEICIREYPNLLLTNHRHMFNPRFHINSNQYDMNKFMSLIKKDVMNEITNKRDGYDYYFTFKTEDNSEFATQVCSAYSIIISRSFQNACNRMCYSITDVIHEIDRNVDILRNLAAGHEIEYPLFTGINGANFIGFNEITLGDACLRQIDGITNPGEHTNRIATQHNDGEQQSLSGHILEIKHKAKISKSTPNMTFSLSESLYVTNEKFVDSLKLALAFSLGEDRGIATSFFESGFSLVQPGNYSMSNKAPGKYLNIDENKIKEITTWFDRFFNVNTKNIDTALKRLKYAIFERQHPEDAVVDAIIAWEAMFSEAFETSFKVTGTISKYISQPSEREAFYSRLKKLYGLRSDIVHGKKNGLLDKECIESLRSEVISIGMNCLTRLISDGNLLAMSPSERVKEILIIRQ